MERRLRSTLLLALLMPVAALGFWSTQASAQTTGTILGQVVDAMSGRPLMDAQVYVPGTGLGVLSNAAGRFSLRNVPPGQVTLRVDLIGYASQEATVTVAAGQTATTNFNLAQDAIALDELVVTGLGKETERRKLSTSVDVLSAEEISQVPVTSVDQLLQGRVAGATVNAQSAQAGTAALINFRGTSSVFARSSTWTASGWTTVSPRPQAPVASSRRRWPICSPQTSTGSRSPREVPPPPCTAPTPRLV
jgi:hypothetical protein